MFPWLRRRCRSGCSGNRRRRLHCRLDPNPAPTSGNLPRSGRRIPVYTAEGPSPPAAVPFHRPPTMNMLKKTIRPEFLNRIDETIMFLPLNEKEIKQIVLLQIKGVQKMLAENGVELKLTEGALDFLSQVGYDPEFGARPVKRAIQRYLLNDLSKKLLSQEVDRSKAITVDAGGDGLVFRN